MKRLLIISLFIVLLLSTVVYAETPITVEEAVRKANEEIERDYVEPNYYELSKINKSMWSEYGALVYGEPHGDKKGSMSRYIGYTPFGEPFGNPEFPRDEWTGGTFDERKWIDEPWLDKRTQAKGATSNLFNGTEKFAENMRIGLLMNYPEDTDGSRTDWHKYMQILQPPTMYSPGMAKMWHVSGGTIWYTTMILPSHQDSSIWMMNNPEAEIEPPAVVIVEPVLEPIPIGPIIVYDNPRTPNVAVKWDTVPIKIGASSSTTGKIERDAARSWNEYKYVVNSWYPNESTGSIVRSNTLKTVSFSNNMFLKANVEVSTPWFTDSPKASYSVPSIAKPGTVLIVELQVWKRVNQAFPSMPATPQKPKPEVSKPSYSRPTRPNKPSSPGVDATDSEKDSYRSAMSSYRDKLDDYYVKKEPWDRYDAYIASPAYQEYLKRLADVNKLSSVKSAYSVLEDKNPTLSPVSGYNFSEYAKYHTNFNNFVNSHYKRYVSIEGDKLWLYWFTKNSSYGKAQSKNVVIHNVSAPGGGGTGPGIIIKP